MSDTAFNKAMEAWDGEKITIRPSAVDGFMTCPRQWALYHIGGISSIPGGRAAIGTAIHAGVAQEWSESIITKKKDFNVSAMSDLVAAELVEMDLEGIQYDLGEDLNTATNAAIAGVTTFVEDILPFTDIPIAVEKRYTIDLDNPVAACLSGTVDYISSDTIADIKTSKRKPVPASHATQQTIYKLLAEANGCTVNHNLIQGVVLKTKPEGHIMELEPQVDKTKFIVNTLLETLTLFSEGHIAPDMLFRGNNKHYLCSVKYCAHYSTCPFVQGEAK